MTPAEHDLSTWAHDHAFDSGNRSGEARTRVVLAGNQGWVNTTTLDVSGGALAASFLNLCVAQCLPSQYFNPPQSLYPGAMADITAAVDATRRLGALDVALNFPWLSSA